jgi:hypothetical protein
MENDLGVNDVVTRYLVDSAPVIRDRSVELDAVEEGTFTQPGEMFIVSLNLLTRCTRARHDTLTQNTNSVHGRRPSIKGRAIFDPPRYQ